MFTHILKQNHKQKHNVCVHPFTNGFGDMQNHFEMYVEHYFPSFWHELRNQLGYECKRFLSLVDVYRVQ